MSDQNFLVNLKPCPFCGCPGLLVSSTRSFLSGAEFSLVNDVSFLLTKDHSFFVRCSNPECPISPRTLELSTRDFPLDTCFDMVTGDWNSRSDPDSD